MSKATPSNRIVTGHDDMGRAIVHLQDQIPSVEVAGPPGSNPMTFAVSWQTVQFPVDNLDEQDKVSAGAPLVNSRGTICRVVDFAPRSWCGFHRTVSLDYGIVVSGTVILELDDGVEKEMKQGDVAVQRGTIHAWHNRTDEWAKIVFVLVAAEPIVIDGKELPRVDL